MASMRGPSAPTPIRSLSRSIKEGLEWWVGVRNEVSEHGVDRMPGPRVDYARLLPLVRRAVVRGYVSLDSAWFVHEMFTSGCKLGVDVEAFEQSRKGTRWHRNYKSATEHRAPISKGIRKRLEKGTSYCLGRMNKECLCKLPSNSIIFPMGGVAKKLERDEWRPTSDHTKSEFNLYCSLAGLEHSLTAEKEVEELFRAGRYMAVGDVADAFPLIPLSPLLWKWFFFVWFNPYDETDPADYLFNSIRADFGSKGAPGCFKILFVDVLVGTARSELIVTLPMPIHVDDFALIGSLKSMVDDEMLQLGKFLARFNVGLKDLKERMAAQYQLMIGFLWDSVELSRQLPEEKLAAYLHAWRSHANQRSLTLRELQSDNGTLHRGIKTLPPGAGIFVANVLMAARGLNLPWQKRRVNGAMRRDYRMVSDLVEKCLGRGWFSFDNFQRAPAVDTDASKSPSFAGGGYFSRCGRFSWWVYGSRARRCCIDELEGDTAAGAIEDLGEAGLLHRKILPLNIDNQAFECSARKGWSRTDRLNRILFYVFQSRRG